nr:tetrahydrofolate dehydrogenase/cyclohydrolase catalytic domain-containing protein [Deinobacterium chartae]
MPRRLEGAAPAAAVLLRAAELAAALPRVPHLHVIRLGEDPASVSYVRLKDRRARQIGLRSTVHALPHETSQAELLARIDALNADDDCDGLLVQLPLPAHIHARAVLERIDAAKDVDGFHPLNVGRLWEGGEALSPCTPAGILELLRYYEVPLAGRRAVIVGRSNIVGKPLAALLLRADASVTIAHSRSADLAALTREAEVLLVAVGRPHFVTADMVRPQAVIVDVGVNRLSGETEGRLVGDVHPQALEVAAAYTPVPGGVGPMTVAQLLLNTVLAARRRRGRA